MDFNHPDTRLHVRLLGLCFKMGRIEPYGCQRPQHIVYDHHPVDQQQFERTGMLSTTVDKRTNKTGHQPTLRGGTCCDRPQLPTRHVIVKPSGLQGNWYSPSPTRSAAPMSISVLDSSLKIEYTHVAECKRLNLVRQIANSICFFFNSFTYSLTLFSKSFSSFHHGTCSLSVLCLYLALDGVYHPFWAAVPNNPTLGKHIADNQTLLCTELPPSMTCCSKQLRQGQFTWKALLETTIHHWKQWRFQIWAVPSSFAITGGILVSFSSSA